jgi:hypothetical protein
MPYSTFLYKDVLVGKEIRLLELLPGNWTDLLAGILYKADTNQRYMALSYHWGSSEESHQMQIDGQSKLIRLNLERALRTIRQQTKPVILWVDAICINQDDDTEKGHQVTFMYEIFKKAYRVYAYLGDSFDSGDQHYDKNFKELGQIPRVEFRNDKRDQHYIDQFLSGSWIKEFVSCTRSHSDLLVDLFSLVRTCASGKQAERNQVSSLMIPSGNSAYIREGHNTTATGLLFGKLQAFIDCPWWYRIWVVQEVLVVTKLTIAYVHLSAPFEMFQGATDYLPKFVDRLESEEKEAWVSFSTIANALTRHRIMGNPTLIPKSSNRMIEAFLNNSTGVPLLSLLKEFRYRKSKDPKDKIFALLNVCTHFGNTVPIRPDYSIDVPKLFQEVTEYLFRATGYFWLTYRDLFRTCNAQSDLPSWVPDWSMDGCMDSQAKFSLSSGAVLLYHASDDIWYDPKKMHMLSHDYSGRYVFPFSLGNGALKVDALRLDRVAHIEPLTSGEKLFSKIWPTVLSFASHFLSQIQVNEDQYKSIPLMEALLRVLCGGIKEEFDDAGILPQAIRMDSEYNITFFHMSVLKISGSWGPAWLEQRWNLSGILRLFGFYPSQGRPSILENKYGYKLDRNVLFEEITDREVFKLVQESVRPVPTPDMESISGAVDAMANGRTLFYTEKGWVGIGPPITLVEDEVFLIKGALCPYILRRAQSRTDGGYRLLGDCYVDGIMDGEKYDERRLSKIRLI